MDTFATPTALCAVIEVPAADIRLIAADRTDTTVEVRPADAGKSRDVKAAERVEVTYADGVLRIAAAPAANRIIGESGSVEITVQLPAGSRVEATSAAADLRGVGRLGEVTFDAAQGTVKLDEAAAARLSLQAGAVIVGRLRGPAQITTQQGDLTVTEAVAGAVALHTQHGNITVGAARDASASLDAGTTYGRITNALKNTDGADAALAIRATTGYGDITARSL